MAPKPWAIKSLGSVLERVSDPVIPVPDVLYREIGIRSHGKGIFHKEPVLGKSLGNKRVFKVHSDCFVVNIVFAWEQAVARTTAEETGMIASHRFPMYRPVDGLCDVDFLTYYFKTKKGKYLLELASPGGAGRNKTLGQTEFSRLAFPMPSGEEQAKIAKVLSTWDKAIAVTDKLITNSKAQKKALMQQFLTRKRPRFRRNFRDFRVDDVAMVDTKNLGNQTNGDFEFRYISLSDVSEGRISQELNVYRFRDAPSRARRIVEPGDILMSTVRPNLQAFSKVSIEHTGCIASTGFAVLTPRTGFDGGYIYHYLFGRHITSQLDALVVGSSYPAINSSDVKALTIRCPELKEQKFIASVLDSLDSTVRALTEQLGLLQKEKSALMQQLITGKRRVKLDPAA